MRRVQRLGLRQLSWTVPQGSGESSRKFRLIATDMDSTLLNRSSQVSAKSRDVISHLMQETNVHLAFCTGRMLPLIHPVVSRLEVEFSTVSYNGSFVVGPRCVCVMRLHCD